MPPFTYDPTELFEAIARLANERDQSWRFTKKGDKRPARDIETAMMAKRAKLKARQDAAADRSLAARKQRRRERAPRPGEDIASRMLKAMEPGEWYGSGDLARMAGADRSARGKVAQVMLPRGWVEAAQNGAWSVVPLNPQKIMAGAEPQPKTLYRLTEAGLARRRELAKGEPSV